MLLIGYCCEDGQNMSEIAVLFRMKNGLMVEKKTVSAELRWYTKTCEVSYLCRITVGFQHDAIFPNSYSSSAPLIWWQKHWNSVHLHYDKPIIYCSGRTDYLQFRWPVEDYVALTRLFHVLTHTTFTTEKTWNKEHTNVNDLSVYFYVDKTELQPQYRVLYQHSTQWHAALYLYSASDSFISAN